MRRFDSFIFDADRRLLSRSGAGIHLTPKAFDTLLVLVKRHGHLVTKEELLRQVWQAWRSTLWQMEAAVPRIWSM